MLEGKTVQTEETEQASEQLMHGRDVEIIRHGI